MPDHPLPSAGDPLLAREAFECHAPAALEGRTWSEETPLSIVIEINARCDDAEVDSYLARFDFVHYPAWPPSVTFVDAKTRRYDPSAWPRVEGAPNIAFSAVYGDAPFGMVCNSMFLEYYFWGGHSPDDTIRWNPRRHTFAASLTELDEALRPPFYKGRNG